MNKVTDHPSLVHAEDMKAICKPLLNLGISYFAHVNIDEKGRFSLINNAPELLVHYLNNQYYNVDLHMANAENLGRYVVWDNLKLIGNSYKMHKEAKSFGVEHTFTIIERSEHQQNNYIFATALKNETINQDYLRHLDLLKLFIASFKDKLYSNKNLTAAYDMKYTVDPINGGYQYIDSKKSAVNSNQFLQAINLNRLYLRHEYKGVYLSKQEVICCYYALLGKNALETAALISRSQKTIERHFENVRRKLDVNSKTEIIHIIGSQFSVKLLEQFISS